MRKNIWLFAMLLLLLCGCAKQTEDIAQLTWPKEELTLFVSSDLHWQGEPSQVPYLEEIVDTLLDETVKSAPAALILCGDLTNGGRLEEHKALAQRLRAAEQAGARIFVTMGNHDMDQDVTPEELEQIYGSFGRDNAISCDKDSMSYLTELTKEMWLLSLDCNVYGEKESESAGTISDDTLAWVERSLRQAQEAGAMIVPFSHHNLLVHTMEGKSHNYNIDRGQELAQLLLDYGVPVYLSGHRHNSFIVPIERGERQLNELVTDMPGAYPHRYTTLTFGEDGTIRYAVPSLDVEGWATRTGRTEEELLHFSKYSQAAAAAQIEGSAANAVEKLAEEPAVRAEMVRFYVDFYTHYQRRGLWQEGKRLRSDTGLALWQKYGAESIYGRWMPWILQNQKNDAPEQILGPFRVN